jgi:lipopolysaccharide export system permease protein
MTLPELWQAAMAAPNAAKRAPFLAPFISRIIRAFMLLVIPFIALPLGMVSKRSSSTLGLTVGLILVLLWHKTLEFGESFAAMGQVSIAVGIFLPCLVFALIGVRLFYLAGFRVGAMPLGRLQAAWDSLRGLKKIFIRGARRAL